MHFLLEMLFTDDCVRSYHEKQTYEKYILLFFPSIAGLANFYFEFFFRVHNSKLIFEIWMHVYLEILIATLCVVKNHMITNWQYFFNFSSSLFMTMIDAYRNHLSCCKVPKKLFSNKVSIDWLCATRIVVMDRNIFNGFLCIILLQETKTLIWKFIFCKKS